METFFSLYLLLITNKTTKLVELIAPVALNALHKKPLFGTFYWSITKMKIQYIKSNVSRNCTYDSELYTKKTFGAWIALFQFLQGTKSTQHQRHKIFSCLLFPTNLALRKKAVTSSKYLYVSYKLKKASHRLRGGFEYTFIKAI